MNACAGIQELNVQGQRTFIPTRKDFPVLLGSEENGGLLQEIQQCETPFFTGYGTTVEQVAETMRQAIVVGVVGANAEDREGSDQEKQVAAPIPASPALLIRGLRHSRISVEFPNAPDS